MYSRALPNYLKAFINSGNNQTSGGGLSQTLNVDLLLNADLFSNKAEILTANYGFDGYIGIPGLTGTDAASKTAAINAGVAWENLSDPNAGQRAYTSGVGTQQAVVNYGIALQYADTIPVVFSWPVLGSTLDPSSFRITRSDGVTVTPLVATLTPNAEYNERQTVVIMGDFGNRLPPGESGAIYPLQVSIVKDKTELKLVGPNGPVSAVGLSADSQNPYVPGNGPVLVAAKLNRYSDVGESAPAWLAAVQNNSGLDLYGDQAQFRLRLYTSAGFSPDGIASLLPTDFSNYFRLKAETADGNWISLTETGKAYNLGDGLGKITVVGLADLSAKQDSYDETYIEDHDNYYDIILSGDKTAMHRLRQVEMPSSGTYQAVYNPGGPGNDPTPGVIYTGPSSSQNLRITDAIDNPMTVTYIPINRINGDYKNNLLNGTAKNDIINGIGGNDTLNGFNGDDTLNGGIGNDKLIGGKGKDILRGGSGNDQLVGGAAVDSFSYNTDQAFKTSDLGIDRIVDFTHNVDKIVLSKTTFKVISSQIGKGFSDKSEFALVTNNFQAATSTANIVYNTANGKLFYNPNGITVGLGTGAQFALLTGVPTLNGDDFMIRG